MRIKCLLASLAIVSFMSLPVQAQEEPRHEVAISYGTVPNSIWIEVLSDISPAVAGATYDKCGLVGPIGLEYYYHTSPLLGVGAVATFSSYKQEESFKDVVTTNSTISYFSLMPSLKFNWLRRDNWGLYSKIAAGASLRHGTIKDVRHDGDHTAKSKTTEDDVFFNFQASVIGVEAGNQNVRGFAELGVGEQGVALAGVRFKF